MLRPIIKIGGNSRVIFADKMPDAYFTRIIYLAAEKGIKHADAPYCVFVPLLFPDFLQSGVFPYYLNFIK